VRIIVDPFHDYLEDNRGMITEASRFIAHRVRYPRGKADYLGEPPNTAV
jgi:hypothetical protein